MRLKDQCGYCEAAPSLEHLLERLARPEWVCHHCWLDPAVRTMGMWVSREFSSGLIDSWQEYSTCDTITQLIRSIQCCKCYSLLFPFATFHPLQLQTVVSTQSFYLRVFDYAKNPVHHTSLTVKYLKEVTRDISLSSHLLQIWFWHWKTSSSLPWVVHK